jgi:hypothetical protein
MPSLTPPRHTPTLRVAVHCVVRTAGGASEPFVSARLSFAKRYERRFPRSEALIFCVGARKDGAGRGIEVVSPVEKEPSRSASTRRMRLHRARRRLGLRCVTIPLCEAQIEGLIHRGWLPRDERVDRTAIRKALYSYLDDTLVARNAWTLAVGTARHGR